MPGTTPVASAGSATRTRAVWVRGSAAGSTMTAASSQPFSEIPVSLGRPGLAEVRQSQLPGHIGHRPQAAGFVDRQTAGAQAAPSRPASVRRWAIPGSRAVTVANPREASAWAASAALCWAAAASKAAWA